MLEKISDFFESSWPHADVDLLEDTLTVTLPDKHQYVLNKHGVTQQIWVASPFTGAHHFYMKEEKWRCTRTNICLEDFLLNERNAYAARI
jgi:iron donor protein CyaY